MITVSLPITLTRLYCHIQLTTIFVHSLAGEYLISVRPSIHKSYPLVRCQCKGVKQALHHMRTGVVGERSVVIGACHIRIVTPVRACVVDVHATVHVSDWHLVSVSP